MLPAGNLALHQFERDALVLQQLGDRALLVPEQGHQKMVMMQFAVAEPVRDVDREDQQVPELRRAKRLGELLLVHPLEAAVAAPGGV